MNVLALRDALRTALEACDKARTARDKIAQSVEKADAMLREVDDELASLDDLDTRISEARTQAIAGEGFEHRLIGHLLADDEALAA
ncbi:hypothetical protein AMST5_03005 [freshwater sediment metagenome]|uniref:Uncharacterized protein n=1 Tax=freshwater sediment metagenome TaxID=556182 RepID=A0AA48RB98_9ZZZZ